MDTPICDFIKEYEAKGTSRLHMPGHKGRRIFQENGFDDGALMRADWDITEIP